MIAINPRSLKDQLLFPHECFTQLREHINVAYNQVARHWEVTHYDDVRFIATKYTLFSSDDSKFLPGREEESIRSILSLDPPRHHQLRSLVSQAFTPRALARLEPRIIEITRTLLDAVVDQGEMDVVADLSYPLPVIVIAEMLGIPTGDRSQFKRWSDELVTTEYDETGVEDYRARMERGRLRVKAIMRELTEYFRGILKARRLQPQDDLISSLMNAQVDGESLNEQELLGFCVLLLVAGNITTTNFIGNAILCFVEHPDAMELLRSQPEIMPLAVEEVLRYRSPVTSLGRFATTDIELGGQQMHRGDFVVAWTGCANHDPSHFADPGIFNIHRSPNQHLAFGHGIHFCLGAPLARLETNIALTEMFRRMTSIDCVNKEAIEPVQSTFLSGARHIPITFTPLS